VRNWARFTPNSMTTSDTWHAALDERDDLEKATSTSLNRSTSGFSMLPKKNDPGHLGQKVGVLVDLGHAFKKLRQRSFGSRTGDLLGRRCRRKRDSCLCHGPDSAADGFDQPLGA